VFHDMSQMGLSLGLVQNAGARRQNDRDLFVSALQNQPYLQTIGELKARRSISSRSLHATPQEKNRDKPLLDQGATDCHHEYSAAG